MARKTLYILIALSLLTLDSRAQSDISVDSRVDRDKILIGDVINYSVIVTRDKNVEVLMPSTAENLGMFEIRDYEVHEPKVVDEQIVEQVDYKISTFDTGEYVIPELAIQYRAQGDSSWQTLVTEPHDIVIESLNPDEAGDIRDIKPPMTPPRDYGRLIKFLMFGVLALAVILFVGYYFKRRREGKSLIPKRSKPPRPAHEIALEALARLRESDLLSSGQVKEFYTELSDIVRQYVEGRFFIPAPEMTTTQLVNAMHEQSLPAAEIEKINALLTKSDLVKFAKLEPPADENAASLQLAIDYVNETKLVFDQVEAATQVSTVEEAQEEKNDV